MIRQSARFPTEPPPLYTLRRGEGPILAIAPHDGHAMRAEIAERTKLPPLDRLREEDPYTGLLVDVADSSVVVHRSRFEVDCNRPRDGAVYREPEDAWGLEVWRDPLGDDLIDRSLAVYDTVYDAIQHLCRSLIASHGPLVVLDLHSYNHRRDGRDAPPAPAVENPEVNVGTGSLDRDRWAPVVDAFCSTLSQATHGGEPFDVRENVRFQGGHLSRWLHETFPESVCCLSVEFKKFFMDEWTGKPDVPQIAAMHDGLRQTIPALERALAAVRDTA